VIDSETVIVLEALSVFHVALGDALGAHLVSEYKLGTRQPRPMISVVTVGEIMRIVHWKKYKAHEIATVKQLLHGFQFVGVLPEIVEEFAVLAAALDLNAETKASSKVWVAATCAAVGKGTRKAALLACDSDFRVFEQQGLQVEYVDPAPFGNRGFAS
jgi:hypothetical protein